MKNILIILILFISNLLNAQIVALEDKDGSRIAGVYYKDVHSSLNPFVGTWLYTNGSTSLKIVLVKKTPSSFGDYYEDLIIGEYQYIKNGEEKINTLSNLNITLQSDRLHNISGNTIITDPSDMNCTDCTLGERRLYVGFIGFDEFENQLSGDIYIKKTTVNGQEAIRINLHYTFRVVFRDGQTNIIPVPIIEKGVYTLIKQ
jgi:hypothetical protein